MTEANEDLKAKMREALERKNSKEKGVHEDGPGPREGARVRGCRAEPPRCTGARPAAEAAEPHTTQNSLPSGSAIITWSSDPSGWS